jgi:hypothetical protein
LAAPPVAGVLRARRAGALGSDAACSREQIGQLARKRLWRQNAGT